MSNQRVSFDHKEISELKEQMKEEQINVLGKLSNIKDTLISVYSESLKNSNEEVKKQQKVIKERDITIVRLREELEKTKQFYRLIIITVVFTYYVFIYYFFISWCISSLDNH
jgi:hypothetical protein